MDFDTAIAKAWNDHADDARGVAERLPALQPLVTTEPQLERLIAITHHVHGEHLGEWAGGATALEALRGLPAYREDSGSGQALRRSLASLALSGGTAPPAMSASDEIRVHAMAASNLVAHDVARASQMLRQTLALAERSGLADTDPMHRAIAVAGHNLACTLEEKPDRSTDERALMTLAAQASRHHWERAGTWLEVERAEYRLAMSWLQAGDLAQARAHAQACLDIVDANAGAALERFFGWEALGVVARAAGDRAEHASAVEKARAAFAELAADDQGWCRASLDKLAAAGA
ncbi:MAG: hypothetical protein ABI702_06565 [Burkholderiales bacterium]